MAWVKRNLVFVIIIAVGLLLTLFSGYLLYSSVNANASVSDDYKSTLSNLQQLQQKVPYPNPANIAAAKADQARVKNFLEEFKSRFAPFPAPPAESQQGFKTYLEDSLYRFHAAATNAGVQLPPTYYFSWSSLVGKLTYAPGSIEAWMQQLEEINTILDILYTAKINYLDSLQRVPVSPDDTGGADYLQTASVTNQWGVVTPYKISFRGFSDELAAVLEGFARSSNCFIVKDIDVSPSHAELPVVIQPVVAGQQPMYNPYSAPRMPSPSFERMRGERGGPRYQAPAAPMQMAVAAPAAPTPPMTILSENPLYISISVDVVKIKASAQ